MWRFLTSLLSRTFSTSNPTSSFSLLSDIINLEKLWKPNLVKILQNKKLWSVFLPPPLGLGLEISSVNLQRLQTSAEIFANILAGAMFVIWNEISKDWTVMISRFRYWWQEARMSLPGGSNSADVLFKLAYGRGLPAPTFEQVWHFGQILFYIF